MVTLQAKSGRTFHITHRQFRDLKSLIEERCMFPLTAVNGVGKAKRIANKLLKLHEIGYLEYWAKNFKYETLKELIVFFDNSQGFSIHHETTKERRPVMG